MGMEIPRHWRLKKQRYGLIGEVDKDDQNPRFPPRFLPKYEGIILPPITDEEQVEEDAEAALFVAQVRAYIAGTAPAREGSVREVEQEIHKSLNMKEWESGYLDPKAPWRRLERLKKKKIGAYEIIEE